MVKLVINDVVVPLLNNSVTLNRQINNISELKDRQATYTDKFKVLKTPKTIKLFNFLGVVGNQSRSPYVILSCKLIYNDIEVLSSGNAYITSSSNDFYDVTIYDGNVFLFQEIGNKQLNTLDYTDLAHELTPTNYINSYTNTTGFIYAVSDNGKFDPTSSIEINYQLPSIFVKTMFDKIFNDTSFDYEFVDFSSNKFDRLVLTPKRGFNAEVDAINNPQSITETVSTTITPFNTANIDPFTGLGFYTYQFSLTSSIIPNQSSINNGLITIIEDGQYLFDIDLTLTNLHVTIPLDITVTLIQTGSGAVYTDTTTGHASTTFNFVINQNISALTGDVFHLVVTGVANDETIIIPPLVAIGVAGNFNFNSISTSVIDLNFNSFVGDLTRKAFLKSIMQHFGFMIQPKPNSTTYQFKRMQDILTDTDGALDLSEQFVRVTKESYQLKGYAQLNRMSYQYFDSNQDKFADGFLEVDNLNLKTEKTLFTSPFNACDTSNTLLNNDIVTSTKFWDAERDDDGTIISHKQVDNRNYIAEVKRVYEDINYGLTAGTPVNFTGSVPRLDFRNINFTKIISENYSNLKTVLDWNNVKQIEVRMTAKEVLDFDFFNLIYIDKLASYFYVNKVSYKGKETAKLEIVEVDKIPFECDLVANAGSYPDVPKDKLKIFLDGNASDGTITTWLWEIITEPPTSSATLDSPNDSTTFFNLVKPGDYLIRLTISNSECSDVYEVIITQLP